VPCPSQAAVAARSTDVQGATIARGDGADGLAATGGPNWLEPAGLLLLALAFAFRGSPHARNRAA
jgi:hypothetical protein